jgi:hypothetical protein
MNFFLRRKRIALFKDVMKAACIQADLKRNVKLVIHDRKDDMSVTMIDYEAFEFRARHDFFDVSAVEVAYRAVRGVGLLSYHVHPGRIVHFDCALATVIAERLDAKAGVTFRGVIRTKLNAVFAHLASVTGPAGV